MQNSPIPQWAFAWRSCTIFSEEYMGNGKTGSAMQIETLEEYVVLAKHLNFSKAAIELSMTQSTLSKHIAALEREVGFPVVERSGSVRLTQAGALLLDCAQQTANAYRSGLSRCRKLLAEASPVRLQWFDAHDYFTDFLSSVDDIPFVFVSATEGEGGSYFSNLERNRVDVVSTIDITRVPELMDIAESKGITAIGTGTDRAAVVMSKDNPLASQESLRRIDLKDAEVFMPDGACFDEWRSGILALFGSDLDLKFVLKPIYNSMANLQRADFGDMIWISSVFDVENLCRVRDDVVARYELNDSPILLPRGILYKEDNDNPNVAIFVERLAEFFVA